MIVEIETEIEGLDIYYTTNGSKPDDKSELYKKPITKDGNYTLNATTYRNGKQIGKTITLPYDVLMKRAKK